jgi:hypothetical protein
VNRIAANPIPYRARAGKTREAFARLPGDRLHRGQGGRPRRHDRRRLCEVDRRHPQPSGLNYYETQATNRLWAEPGLGVVDCDAVLAGFDADEPSLESHQISYDQGRR